MGTLMGLFSNLCICFCESNVCPKLEYTLRLGIRSILEIPWSSPVVIWDQSDFPLEFIQPTCKKACRVFFINTLVDHQIDF